MLVEFKWKVLLLVIGSLASNAGKPTHAVLRRSQQKHSLIPYRDVPMFIPKRSLSYRRDRERLSRVLFLDDEERTQQYGRGEIDLTLDKNYDGQIKFDQSADYDFTSPDVGADAGKTGLKDEGKDEPSGNERFYETPTVPRFRPSSVPQFPPKYYQGRFNRPYAPNHYALEQYFPNPGSPFSPAVRNGFYGSPGGWKARSPRVVFPYAPDSVVNSLNVQTNSHGGPPGGGFNDNVVFRDQNFGLDDVASTSDDLALQDLGTSNPDAFSDRDANAPHRARKKNTKRRMYHDNGDLYRRQYIPIYRHHLPKPMFIQTDGKRILPPDIIAPHEFTNISREIGGKNAIIPKFKPISDEQIIKINEILKQMPIKANTETSANDVPKPYLNKSNIKAGRYRKGKGLNDNLIDSASVEESTEKLTITTKGIQRQDEKLCPQGGTCEFFFYCWMIGGLLEGTCGGVLKGCCHRVAKAGVLGVQDSNSIDYSSEVSGLSYGPVINDQSCGIAVGKQTAQRRIVGGDDAGFGTFPWQAYIRIGSSRCNMLMSIFELIGWKQCWIERCGGSLISRRHVVTAGHCVARAQPRHVRVTLGDYVINSAAEPLPAYTFGVRTIKVHPLFKFTPQADRFDVAVLTLDRNVHYMPHIAPICLPERGSDFLGQYGWAAGWGALSPGSRLRPRTLQAVDVPVLDNRVCERWHRANGINVVIYPEMLCAGYRGGGKDSCQGDSGGPLMLERTGRWYLIGVVSAGYSCASRGQPGIYHRVAHTVDWISHATTLS